MPGKAINDFQNITFDLAGSGFYSMYAHSFEDIDKYLTACDEVFGELAKLIQTNSVEANLQGNPAKVGFARIN